MTGRVLHPSRQGAGSVQKHGWETQQTGGDRVPGSGPKETGIKGGAARADTWVSGWHGEDAKGNTEDRKGLAPSTPPKSQGENARFHPCYSPCQWPESSQCTCTNGLQSSNIFLSLIYEGKKHAACTCSQKHHSREPKSRNSQNVIQPING